MAVSIQPTSEPPGLTPEILEQLVQGDLSKLTPQQRVVYYKALCDRLGIDAAFQPFGYLLLNGKLVLYALKNCAEQLRKRHGISIGDLTAREFHDIYIVTAHASLPNGRTDTSTGAVSLGNKKGDDLANAIMKSETKAKRRVTLSISGLGMLDETEIEAIPGARIIPTSEAETELIPPQEIPPPIPERKPREGDNRNVRIHSLLRELEKINPQYRIGQYTAAELADRKSSRRRHEFYMEYFKQRNLADFSDEAVNTLELALKRRKAEAQAITESQQQ